MIKHLVLAAMLLMGTITEAKVVASSTGPQGTMLLDDAKCANGPFYKFQANDLKAQPVLTGCWFAHGNTIVILVDTGEVEAFDARVFDWGGGI